MSINVVPTAISSPKGAPIANMTSNGVAELNSQVTTQIEYRVYASKGCTGPKPRYCISGSIYPEYHFFSHKKRGFTSVAQCIRCRLVRQNSIRRHSSTSVQATEDSLLRDLQCWKVAVIKHFELEPGYSTEPIQTSLTESRLKTWAKEILESIRYYDARAKQSTSSETMPELDTNISALQPLESDESDTEGLEDLRDPEYRPDRITDASSVDNEKTIVRILKRKADDVPGLAFVKPNAEVKSVSLPSVLPEHQAQEPLRREPPSYTPLPPTILGSRSTPEAIEEESINQSKQDKRVIPLPPQEVSDNPYTPSLLDKGPEDELSKWLDTIKKERERLKDKDVSQKLPKLRKRLQAITKEFFDDLEHLFVQYEDFDRRWL